MFNTSFFLKVYLSYVFIIILTALSLGVFLSARVTENTLAQIDETLKGQSLFLSQIARPAFLDEDEARKVQQTIEQFASELESRLTVIKVDGLVLADTDKDPATMDNHATRPEVIESQSKPFGSATRFSDTVKQNMRYMSFAVREQGELLGYVRASMSLKKIDNEVYSLQQSLMLLFVIPLLVALLLGYILARKFTRPIYEIIEGAQTFVQGNYHYRIPFKQYDELGRLASSINKMARVSGDRVQQLTTDKNKLATILSGMVEGVIAVDEQQKVIHINEAAASLLNVSATASHGVSAWEILKIKSINEILLKVLKNHQVIKEKIKISSEDSERVIQVYCASIKSHSNEDDSMQKNGAILVLHDLTVLTRLERVRQDFVANASHELKTPLTVIKGTIETVLDDPDMPKEILFEFLNKVNAQSNRLASLISDLLTISRLENSKESLQHTLELTALVKQVHKNFLPIAQEKNIFLELDIAVDELKVKGEQQALSQVFDNLVDNAIKYTPENGKVKLSMELDEQGVVVAIEDNGIGIEKENLSRVFERFYRVDKARSRALGSTGLGLSIVKHIVEQHEGRVCVESEYGKGTTFKVYLNSLS